MSGKSGIYEELGVRRVINARGHPTVIGGNTPSAAVRAAMEEADEDFVDLGDLIDAVSGRVAGMLGIEAALVTPGCAAALALGAAACMTGNDLEKIERVPDVADMPHEFIIQRQLRVGYDRAITIPGGKLVEVGEPGGTRPEHIEAAIGPKTAGIHYLAGGLYDEPDERKDSVHIADVIDIAHSHDLPVIVDAAGQVYPTDRLSRYVKMGADIVCYGAKYFGGVNSSGLLTGKKELVRAAQSHSFVGFEADGIRAFGRVMKMDRQSVVAVYVALKEWLTMNHEDRISAYYPRLSAIRDALVGVEGVGVVDFPDRGLTEGLRIRIDGARASKTVQQLVDELYSGDPRIMVREHDEPDSLVIRIQTVNEGDEKIIARRLREILG